MRPGATVSEPPHSHGGTTSTEPRMTSATRPLGEILDARQRFIVLFSLILCTAVNALDASIVAPAMPHVLADLGGFELISWVFTAYLLPSTVVVAIVGKVSDM